MTSEELKVIRGNWEEGSFITSEDTQAVIDEISGLCDEVEQLQNRVNELESMPLVHDVVEQKQEIERLSEEIESWKSSMASTVNSTGSYISNLEIENKQLRETLLEIQIESSCDGAGRTLNRINDIASKAFNQRESKPEITRHALEDDAHATL